MVVVDPGGNSSSGSGNGRGRWNDPVAGSSNDSFP
jgi:hypothetical protein